MITYKYDYSRLDPLISISGEKITSVEDWKTYRREEIMVLLSNFVYGVRPMERPDDISFRVDSITENYLGYPIVRKSVTISFLGYDLPFDLFLPQDCYRKRPVPVFLHIMNENSMRANLPVENPDNGFLPIKRICERGFGVAAMATLDVAPDWGHLPGFKKGVFRAVQPNAAQRDQRSWGTISGWAYGASRIMDYLETDPGVRHAHVAVIGHSRAGKAALWAGATDTRFSLVISNDSGCSGAAFTRYPNEGRETIKRINVTNWFCENYKKYNDREEMFPCDQHLLLAAIAPRALYVKSNAEDAWAGPEAELESAKLASPVYELYGKKGIVVDDEIEVGKSYHEGTIGYHRAPGDHDLSAADWEKYMDFAELHLKKQR